MPRLHLWLCILLLVLLPPLPSGGQEPAPPHSRTEWVSRLRSLPNPLGRDDYLFLNQFQALDAKTVYQIVRENWAEISSEHGRTHIVQYTAFEPHNPYLLAILHMGRTDHAPRVQQMAIRCLRLLTFQDFADEAIYLRWYREEQAKPLREVVGGGCRSYVGQLESATTKEKLQLLDRFLEIPFAPQESSEASQPELKLVGLMQMRREAVLASGLMSLLCGYLEERHPPLLRRKALVCIAHFQPERALLRTHEARVRWVIPALLEGKDATLQEKLELLANLHTDWAVKPLLQLAQEEYGETNTSTLVRALVKTESLRVVPLLIVMLEIAEAEQDEEERSHLTKGLTQLTGQTSQTVEAGGWRVWWNRSGRKQSPDFSVATFPRLALRLRATQRVLRRLICPIYSENSLKPIYWHIASGRVWDVKRENRRLGLLAVLFDPDTPEALPKSRQWQEALGLAFQGDYVVALIPVSKQQNRSKSREQVHWAVKDASTALPIDPQRIWLMAAGEQTATLYACADSKERLFRGFWVVNSHFRQAWLTGASPLLGARFLVEFAPKRTAIPALTPLVAKAALSRLGGQVHLLSKETSSSLLESLKEAVGWLEIAKGF